MQSAVGFAGALGRVCACASPLELLCTVRGQLVAQAAGEAMPHAVAVATHNRTRRLVRLVRPMIPARLVLGYEVQPSVAGLVVAVAAPPVAVMPVRDGIEK